MPSAITRLLNKEIIKLRKIDEKIGNSIKATTQAGKRAELSFKRKNSKKYQQLSSSVKALKKAQTTTEKKTIKKSKKINKTINDIISSFL